MTEKKPSWQNKLGKTPKNDENSSQNAQNDVQNEQNEQENVQNEQNGGDLQDQLLKEQEKSADLNNKLLRALAELENTRRRAKEEQIKASNYAISGFVTDLVVVTENFFLACDNLPKIDGSNPDELKHLVEAIEMTRKEMVKTLEKHNVKRVYPLNQKFDHSIHEAVSYVENEAEEGEVIQVVQAGYVLGNRIIRPSLVVVSKGNG